MSYEDILADRDDHQPDYSDHSSSDDPPPSLTPSSSSAPTVDDEEEYEAAQAAAQEEEEEDWDTGNSPEKTAAAATTQIREDGFFRVNDHPSLTKSTDGPSELLPPSFSDEDDDDDDDGSGTTFAEEELERREDLLHHERTRRSSTSVKYDAPQQLAVEYILRREEACTWLRIMLAPAGLHQLSDSMLSTPTKLAQGLCNGVVLCEVIRCLRGLRNGPRSNEMLIHRTFPPAMVRNQDLTSQYIGPYWKTGTNHWSKLTLFFFIRPK